MGKLPTASDSDNTARPDSASAMYLLGTMADTTWRIFVPPLTLLLIGNYYDDQFGTTPWLLLLGAGVGGLIAAWLIKQQLAKGTTRV